MIWFNIRRIISSHFFWAGIIITTIVFVLGDYDEMAYESVLSVFEFSSGFGIDMQQLPI